MNLFQITTKMKFRILIPFIFLVCFLVLSLKLKLGIGSETFAKIPNKLLISPRSENDEIYSTSTPSKYYSSESEEDDFKYFVQNKEISSSSSTTTTEVYFEDLLLEKKDEAQILRRYESPWSWSCETQPFCSRVNKNSVAQNDSSKYKLYNSLSACWLSCPEAKSILPLPKKFEKPHEAEVVYFKIYEMSLEVSAPSQIKTLTESAFQLLKEDLNKLIPSKNENESQIQNRANISILIQIKSADERLTLTTNESYSLKIINKNISNIVVEVNILAESFYGARHGLESLSQLMDFDKNSNLFMMATGIWVEDEPAFPYRGLMVDSARNFIPIKNLKRVIDGMSYNKLNRLHWHLTDSNSFSFYSKSYPEMTNFGAYSENEIYFPEDIRNLINYGKIRGVEIIPELDAPAHAGNGWQWGEEKGLGSLALCVNKEPFNYYCGQPPCGQLNPINNNTYSILGSLYQEMHEVFESTLFHMGGDEVYFECWKTPEINNFMNESRLYGFSNLWGYFQNKAYNLLENAYTKNSVNGSDSKGVLGILWTSGLTSSPSTMSKFNITPQNYIIQSWEGSGSSNKVRNLLRIGFPIILSTVDIYYLDWGSGTWLGKDQMMSFINWQKIYDYDYRDYGFDIKKRVSNALYKSIPQILGGEAPLWSEKVDAHKIDGKLWPRGSALAERLWSNPNSKRTFETGKRLYFQSERMRLRGIFVTTRQPKSCLLINGNCEDRQKPI